MLVGPQQIDCAKKHVVAFRDAAVATAVSIVELFVTLGQCHRSIDGGRAGQHGTAKQRWRRNSEQRDK